jgi:hypothetical protein
MLTSAPVRGLPTYRNERYGGQGDVIDMLNRIIKIYQGKD